jgi:hypothetical protein
MSGHRGHDIEGSDVLIGGDPPVQPIPANYDPTARNRRVERAAENVIRLATEHPTKRDAIVVPKHLMDALFEALR